MLGISLEPKPLGEYGLKDVKRSLECWRIWYEAIQNTPESELSEHMRENKRCLFRVCQCVAKLEPYERQIITDKYFNLKELPRSKHSDTFRNRSQTDKELAEKYGMTKAEFLKFKYKATYKIMDLWQGI